MELPAASKFDRYFLFALMISTSAILDLAIGLSGNTNSTVFTGLFILGSTATTLLVGRWRGFSANICDVIFVFYATCVAISLIKNGWPDNSKEVALLILSLAAYPAGRLVPGGRILPSFIAVIGLILLVGSIAAVPALAREWGGNGKIAILGLGATATHLLTSLGFLAIGLGCMELSLRRAAFASALVFVPAAIFATSMVRFTFVGVFGGLFLGLILSAPRFRLQFLVIILAIAGAVIGANIIRWEKVTPFAHYAADAVLMNGDAETSPPKDAPDKVPEKAADKSEMPSCSSAVNMDDTIAIRRALLKDALYLIPTAGLFGKGLDGFMRYSCVKDHEIHNSIAQATLEFGWLAGGALLLLILLSVGRLLPVAQIDSEARFAVCSLCFVLILTMAHGRTSRDALLFLLLGFSAGVSLPGKRLDKSEIVVAAMSSSGGTGHGGGRS